MAEVDKRIARKIDKAIHEFEMIAPGDRILLAVSGGKDSLALAYHLVRKSRNYPIPFTVSAVHVHTDFSSYTTDAGFLDVMDSWGLETKVVDVRVRQRLKPGRKLNCYWCATQRRMELMKEAKICGANKIALGHHLDDILETFLMNMAGRSEMSTMLPTMTYDRYPITLIRPLAWVHEAEIIEFVDRMGLEGITCRCAWDTRSPRRTARRALEVLTEGNAKKKDNLFKALSNPIPRYLPGGITRGLE